MSCLHPRVIRNIRGEYMRVPCGHCEACINAKGLTATSLCFQESVKHKYQFFVTLTYDRDHLPLAMLVPTVLNDNGSFAEVQVHWYSRGSVKFDKRFARYYGDSMLIDTLYDTDTDFTRIFRPFNVGKYDTSEYKDLPSFTYPYLFKYDLQNFFKRLRYYAESYYLKNFEECAPTLRYFGVGEYGPLHLRPHYHAIIYCDDERLLSLLQRFVCKAWTFGRYDCQLANSSDSQKYCARYVNCLGFIPTLLTHSSFRPFSIHSRYFGSSSDEAYYQSCFENSFERLSQRGYKVGDCIKQYPVSLSLQRSLFPKCFGYGTSSDNLCLVRYRSYEILSRHYHTEKVSNIVSAALIDRPNVGVYSFDEFVFGDNVESTLTSLLYTSKLFCRLCDRYGVSAWFYYNKVIVPYYKDKDYEAIRSFYQKYEEDSQSAILLPLHYLARYSNIPNYSWDEFMRLIEHGDNDAKIYFNRLLTFGDSIGVRYARVLVDQNENYTDTPDQDYNVMLQSKIYNDSIKHKRQNDANKLLFNS